MKRYYIGVDWGDRLHQVYVGDEEGKKVREMKVPESPRGWPRSGAGLMRKEPKGLSFGRPLRSRRGGSWTFCSITGWRFTGQPQGGGSSEGSLSDERLEERCV